MSKVLFTASTYSHIAQFHLPYLRHFQERGWTVHAACGGTPEPLAWADEVIHLPLKKSMGAPENFQAAALLRRRIAAEGYDFISTHTSLAAFFTRLAVKGLRRRPAVANMVHGYLYDEQTPALRRAVLEAAERLTAPQTDLLLTMTQWDYREAERHRLGREVVHIPGIGVDFSRLDGERENPQALRAAHGIPEDAFVLVYAAEFSKRKSQSVLIRAMARLPETAVLVLAGDGALRDECMALARELEVADRVVFPGRIQDMASWYALADASVSSSRSEGLPFNVMEAMYMGLPVAASRVKGHVDLLVEGETGLLFPYGDWESCADQVERLMVSPELRQKLAENARASVEQYSLERVRPVVLAQYGTLLPELVPAERL